MPRRLALIAVAVSLALLMFRAARVGVSGDYLDPVAHVTAQDESFYGNSAIHMATRGEWLTPRFMDRYSLYKPPLILWLSGVSARIFGVSRFTLRLPLALLCSLAAGLVFLIAAKIRSPQAGAAAALLLIGNHLWNVTASMLLTDALLATFAAAALYCVFVDSRLESRLAFWGFALAIAGAILTKTVAGVLPIAGFGLYWLFGPRAIRAPFLRVCAVLIAAYLLASPWFFYQLFVHHKWFWTEHVLQELLGFGTGAAAQQTTAEAHTEFYLARFAALEPALAALFLLSLWNLARALRAREWQAIWLACWLAPVLAAPFLWGYRNATYLVPSIAPMAIAAACYFPKTKRAWHVLALPGVATLAALLFPAQTWGLSFASGTIEPAAPAVSQYCEQARGNQLISVEMKDDLYASVLPLARLRYVIVSPHITGGEFILLDFAKLGISLTPDQFNRLETLRPAFQGHLRAVDLTSGDPIGTLIVAPDQAALLTIVNAHPDSDFLFPAPYKPSVQAARFPYHRIEDAGPDLFFLLALTKLPRGPLPWPCRM